MMYPIKRLNGARVFTYGIAYGVGLIVIIPLVQIVLSSFKSNADIYRGIFFPRSLLFENYVKVFRDSVALFSFVNSLLICASAGILIVFLCSLAAYSIARRREKFFQVLYGLFLSAMIIPPVATLVPLYSLVVKARLYDTRLALILLYTATSIPMGILMYSSFIKTVPMSLEEAAMIEGAGYFQRFFLIVFPLLRSITVSFVVLRIPGIWNDFLFPLLLLRSKWKKTITLMVYAFTREHEADSGAIFALLVLAALLPMLFFIFTHKTVYRSIAGSVKG